ncbi:PREDICTED: SURP and G-patch domain-containing protein 1-like protein isoform X1 [Lupinus angustifolius]|uniref:SURP and G-patch domain-containing protein 1-like protein isoform X1 n=1 Tax=Lupinus angustifolius TaxID=3871 RepID=UPI00092E78A0|nr:PREDICTED: SURP and G-patch domain-containing protein 1-like protein isoform X1 [Lupinus angustifolius]XP_019413452.1 PREDICTED: SURP and G-patch domain-containing protein 1-like protein isoform X1 [Lupinus angustifolius]XP_019413453.1 PREDICTED: SURP and G-patch domain-containing protein 1-like protein isoform X1 [Lupinus angustifolius]XP_019413454.1 PREDICTED: SURP and G-patch domain-containing protein 1-like protein isoform X1 [Lupinus angustifolius]
MDKGTPPSLFVNDGSFLERFKQLQQEQEKGKNAKLEESKPIKVASGSLASNPSIRKANDTQKTPQAASGGKLAFSLKQKSKLVPPPVNLADDDEEETGATDASNDAPPKRQKLGQADGTEQSLRQLDVAPSSPSDPTVKKVADKLASFVAKNGRQFEDVTRQKNPGDTPFKFLFDEKCADYKYYEYRLAQEDKALAQSREPQAYGTVLSAGGTSISSFRPSNGPQKSSHQHSTYQIPASVLYDRAEEPWSAGSSVQASSAGNTNEPSGSSNADSLALMEFYMKRAAQEERSRRPKHSKDEMPPPASLQTASGKKGHHMGDYIPLEELEKFMANCNDAEAQKAAKEAAERAKIQADNVGHKLLSKMGWKEGEGLGSSRKGIADPIMAGSVKKDNLGVGAVQPGEVTPEDDIYEQYKKRMMLGYRHRPNPLNNPRKAYY